jgi:hypothetical protein
MRFLKKMLIAIAGMIILAVPKFFFARFFASSSIFHYNLFGSLQLLLLLWAIFTGLLEMLAWTGNPPRQAHKRSLTVFILLIALGEILCGSLLYHPRLIPGKWFWAFSNYYSNYQRNIMQYDKKIATYDDSLFYRLKPDTRSLFSNFEFADSIFTNDWGFRDHPISMDKVKVVCLGDSYTVGWGVGQEEAYPQQLEKIIKIPVLNTGVSSYGTAREVSSIRRLDIPNADYIVIEYSNNDAPENEAYVKNNFRLRISPERVYDSICNEVYWSTVYFPGKYFCTIAKLLIGRAVRHFPDDPDADKDSAGTGEVDAHLFLDVLKRSGWDFGKLQVVIFNIDEETESSLLFIPALTRQLAEPGNKEFFKGHLHVMSVTGLLGPADRYLMDPHLRPSGQKKIAQELARLIQHLP